MPKRNKFFDLQLMKNINQDYRNFVLGLYAFGWIIIEAGHPNGKRAAIFVPLVFSLHAVTNKVKVLLKYLFIYLRNVLH